MHWEKTGEKLWTSLCPIRTFPLKMASIYPNPYKEGTVLMDIFIRWFNEGEYLLTRTPHESTGLSQYTTSEAK